MNGPAFISATYESLDKDLASMLAQSKANAVEVILLQQLRIMRGRPLPVVEMTIEGWSADGKTWLPSEPGTHNEQK